MNSIQPKYIQVKNIIKDGIRDGSITGKLAGERVLAKNYQVSYMTVRKAVSELVEEGILKGGQRSFLVDENGIVRGLLTLSDVRTIPERKWRFTTSQQVMQPFERVVKIEPTTELPAALQMMDEAKVSQLPVVDDNRVLGLLSRETIFNYLRLRNELGA